MNPAIDIIKRGGARASESFSREKLHSSISAACLSVRSPEGEAETVAEKVCDHLVAWLTTKPEVTSHDLRLKAASALEQFHPEAAYLYQHHRLVL